MIDYTKFNPEKVITKTSEVAVKAIEFNQCVFKESMKFFNDITDKAFYTYTVQALDAVDKVTGYAKETITNQKIPNLFGVSK